MEQQVIEIIEDQLGLTPGEVTIESNMENDLGADSLDMVEITLYLEEKFNIEIPDEEAVKFKTVQDICTYLNTNTGG